MGVYDPTGNGAQGYTIPNYQGGPPAPVTANQFTYNRVRYGDPHTIRDAQTFLNGRGYHLAIDGMWGPQTSAALKAYFNHIHPQAHNAAMRAAHPNAAAAQRTIAARNGRGPKGMKVGKGGKVAGGGGGAGAPMPSVGGPFNPKKVAMAMANQEYGPAIAQLQGLLGDVSNQDQYNQKNIHGWYQQMKNLMNQQYAEQQQVTQQGEQGVTNAIGQDAQLFGGDNAGQMATAASNASGYLGAVGQSQQDYLKNMLPLLDAQAAQGTANEQNAARAQQNNYESQLQAQMQAKGAAYQTNYEQALSDQATQEQNQLALQQAQALMPYQISSARSQARADRINANYAGKINQAKVNASQAQVAHYAAMSQEEMAATKKYLAEAAKSGTTKSALAPGSTSYERVVKGLTASMYNSRGKAVVPNPVMAQRSLFQAARQQGLIDAKGRPLVPGALRVLNATLQSMYARDAAWQAKYRWNGRTFVPK